MATITVRVEVEEALIRMGISRREWAEFVNIATLEKIRIREKK